MQRYWATLAEIAFVGLVVVAFVATVAPSLEQPLLERHDFRQTQTAYTARIYHEEGIDVLHPKTPVLGAPFEAPFEFPLFQAIASLVMDTGVRDDVALRTTGLACFLLTALLLYGLMRHIAGRSSAIPALVAFTATPFALLWSRASLIEYLATAGAVGFTWATVVHRERGGRSTGALALLAGLVGMLVKPTTAVFWLIPALAYRPGAQQARSGSSTERRAWLVAITVAPLAAAALWTRHADGIKAASPTTEWLTSEQLRTWNFGTLAQRLSLETWQLIGSRLILDVVGLVGLALLVLAAAAVVKSPQRWFWVGIALTAVLPPLVFTNLYRAHDYYLAAVTPSCAMLLGLGAGYAWRLLPRSSVPRAVAIGVGLVLALNVLMLDASYWHRIYRADPNPEITALAREISDRTEPSDRVGVVGLDWSPAALYYANRWGLMVVDRNSEISYDALHRDRYRYLVAAQPDEADLSPLARWRWVGVLGPHLYGLADDARRLPPAPAVVTDSAGNRRHGQALGESVLHCGESASVPAGRRGTVLELSYPPSAGTLSVSPTLAPLPLGHTVYLAPRLADSGRLAVVCSGPTSVRLEAFEAAATR